MGRRPDTTQGVSVNCQDVLLSTMAQVAIGWLLSRGENVVPIPGTKRRKYLEENAAAVDIVLSDTEIKSLEQAFPPNAAAGLRYPEFQLKMMGI